MESSTRRVFRQVWMEGAVHGSISMDQRFSSRQSALAWWYFSWDFPASAHQHPEEEFLVVSSGTGEIECGV
jgi:hypothetical protein